MRIMYIMLNVLLKVIVEIRNHVVTPTAGYDEGLRDACVMSV